MASRIIEFFGFDPTDNSSEAANARRNKHCPFLNGQCLKTLSDRTISGACTLQPTRGNPVICCPIRLYANDYQILKDVARTAFGLEPSMHPGAQAKRAPVQSDRARVAVFGKQWGGELRLPTRGQTGGYYVDWVLAKLNDAGDLEEFVAIEVQSIDTTGNYREERDTYLRGQPFAGTSTAGFNWENVNKRILPQLIYKGNVLQRERMCKKGLFFVCPKPVYEKISERLGGGLLHYPPQTGSITFSWYDVGPSASQGHLRPLVHCGSFTTHVVQVATAFTSPTNLPEANVYEKAIKSVL